VAAALHYDVYHNTLVQVAGTKRVWLLPPSELASVRLYPSLHARYRQSQVTYGGNGTVDDDSGGDGGRGANVSAPSVSTRPPLSQPPLLVTLQPGMALYIPPMWLHAVDTPVGNKLACVDNLLFFCSAPLQRSRGVVVSQPRRLITLGSTWSLE
jgi:hypothetical protein